MSWQKIEVNSSKTIQAGFEELLQDETVIYAVLRKMQISNTHSNYDDFVSEARFLYLKAYTTNDREGKARFNYFFNKIYWGLLDVIRKEQRIQRQGEIDEELFQINNNLIDPQVDLDDLIEHQDLMYEIHARCSQKEWLYVQYRFCGFSMKEIAAIEGVHLSAIYQIRQRLKRKFSNLL